MAMPRVVTEGSQYLTRTAGARITPLHQMIQTELAEAVTVEVTGAETGAARRVASSDPAVLSHYRDLDRAQLSVAILDAPTAPDPVRVPIDPRGRGLRTCEACQGVGMIDTGDAWLECADCRGEGVLPNPR